MDKYIGRLLDNRYEILEIIGTGGMAVVYKARCHRLNRLVAIKILKDDYMEDEEFRRRFHSESQAVAMLSHPNIVSVYDVSSSITADYIVMELIDGITLKQYMEKKGVLNWKETLHFAIQIGKALEHAHSRGIVHRDIKPHNVMVLKNGSVKVTDFGIARMMSQSHTLTKEALGSVHYISPEQAKGGRVDNRSDIYSLGVVMYEMMSGRPPYDGESPVAVAIQHINGGAQLPSSFNPNIPGGLEQIIMHAMSLEPSGRYATAAMMLADMDEFRKNPGILFDYNIPGMGELLRPKKQPAFVPEVEQPAVVEQQEEKKLDADMPPLVMPPRKQNVPTGSTNQGTSAGQTTGNRQSSGTQIVGGSQGAVRRNTDGNRRTQAERRQRASGGRNDRKREEKENKVATIAIIACAALMVLAILIFLIVLLGSGSEQESVAIPDLVGKDFEQVQYDTSLGVKIQVGEKLFSTEYPEGQIMHQTPEFSDKTVAKGSVIIVDVSMGPEPEPVMMPNILNWESTEAERAMDNLGIQLDIEYRQEYNDQIEAGKVISTTPAAKEQLKENDKVIIIVSLGMELKTGQLPDLKEKTKENAEQLLTDMSFNLNFVYEEVFDSKVKVGCIVKTEPEAGAKVSTGDTVTLYISKGPNLVRVPNVIELKVDAAIGILKGEGFQNYSIQRVSSDKIDRDCVIRLLDGENEIAVNNLLDTNTLITIQISSGSSAGEEQPVTKEIKIWLPEDYITPYTLVVKLGEEERFSKEINSDDETVCVVQLTDSGKKIFDVYINNTLYKQEEVDFTSE